MLLQQERGRKQSLCLPCLLLLLVALLLRVVRRRWACRLQSLLL